MRRNSIWSTCLLASLASAALASTPAPIFSARRDYPDIGQRYVAIADTNSDGIPDITAMGDNVQVLFGNGNGTFRAGPETETGMIVSSATAADLNGDSELDLILVGQVYSSQPSGIGVCLGNGNGTFQAPVFYPAGSDTIAEYVAIGDFNGDGIIDVATVGTSGIWLFTGKGGGVFNPAVLIPFTGATGFNYIAAADFRKDGKMDLVVTTSTGFAVLLGNGNGTFQPQQNFTNPQDPKTGCSFALGALTTGGYPAIVASCGNPDYQPIYASNGKGGFTGPTYAYMPGGVGAIADVNGDGIPDLINQLAYVALGEGHGKFKTPAYYPTEDSDLSANGGNVVAAHLRSASLMDLVVQGTGAVSVLLNTNNTGFEDGRWTALPSGAGCGVAANYAGGANPGLAVTTFQGLTILLGTGSASAPFTVGTSIALSNPDCLVTADLNGDGIPDLLVPNFTNPEFSSAGFMNAYLGNGNGTFTLASSTPISAVGSAVAADFNNDGNMDFATSSNLIALGNGNGTFQTPTQLVSNPPETGFQGIATGDVNNDGWPDLVLTSYNASTVYVLLNNQRGGFTVSTVGTCKQAFTGPCYPTQVILADLNGHGNLDLVVSDSENGGVAVYLGNGQGGFTQSAVLTDVLLTPGPIMVADVNGDGIPDIVLAEAATLAILRGCKLDCVNSHRMAQNRRTDGNRPEADRPTAGQL